ncbi:MAG: hypothetical protein U9Q73_00190 [Nanoarchaeota archaeon]|nr:hypothetical protein [Nanoarchaeota archaeon]
MTLPNLLEIKEETRTPDMEKECSFVKVKGLRQEFKEKCTILLTLMCPNSLESSFRKS